jgi:hypothetical protein
LDGLLVDTGARVGLIVGAKVGLLVRTTGATDGLCVDAGARVGLLVGNLDGVDVGAATIPLPDDGEAVVTGALDGLEGFEVLGLLDGLTTGLTVGFEGFAVLGLLEGVAVLGLLEGFLVLGALLPIGLLVGSSV